MLFVSICKIKTFFHLQNIVTKSLPTFAFYIRTHFMPGIVCSYLAHAFVTHGFVRDLD